MENYNLARLLICCGRLTKLNIDVELRRRGYDVTPTQSHALLYLAKHTDEEVTQRALEQSMRLKASTINGIVDRLLEKGYITRCPSPRDGRCRLLYLTDAGRELVGSFCAALEQTDQTVLIGLSQEEQSTVEDILRRIIVNLESEVKKT